jgi:hypothetical protein
MFPLHSPTSFVKSLQTGTGKRGLRKTLSKGSVAATSYTSGDIVCQTQTQPFLYRTVCPRASSYNLLQLSAKRPFHRREYRPFLFLFSIYYYSLSSSSFSSPTKASRDFKRSICLPSISLCSSHSFSFLSLSSFHL